jgi:hypothetical protein
MRALVAGLMLAAASLTACGPRKVEVGTGAPAQSNVALHVTNNTGNTLNVYVVQGGNELLVGQVAANSQAHLPVAGVAPGSTVDLRARVENGTTTYSKPNVVLTESMYLWTIP